MTRRRLIALVVTSLLFIVGGVAFYAYGRTIWVPAYQRIAGKRTVADVLRDSGPAARATWSERMAVQGLAYPPDNLVLIGIKRGRVLEVWTETARGNFCIATYPILGASGEVGPKLREGDRQVPEGLYRIEGLNPNSAFHLSMKVNYPNEFDRARAQEDGRTNLGGDIFIHGNRASIGCLAMGDAAIEELFVLVADVGLANTRVLISPEDYRAGTTIEAQPGPPWLTELYGQIAAELAKFE